MKVVTVFLTLSLVLAACVPIQPGDTAPVVPTTPPRAENTPATPPETVPETNSEDSLANTQWVLDSFGTVGSESPVVGENAVTLEFASDGQVGGSASCNSYGGSYSVQDNTLALAEIVSTLMACVDTALMEQEVQYLDALQTVSEFQVDGARLTISYDEGQSVLNFISASANTSEDETPPTDTPAPEAEVPSIPAAETVPAADVATGASQSFFWNCFFCSGNQIWGFENGQASQLELPVAIERFYGYAPATGRVLYSSPLGLLGAGPSEISVGDLWMLDMASGQAEPVISEQAVVEAALAPDGEQLVYVLAIDTTYELRWRGLNGEDILLASDVAFTFSISPNGDKVAFTRESNYDLPGQPGLYVVDVATSEEQMLSDVDRAGSGSIEDKPAWSPSGQHVLLPTYGTTGGPGLLRAALDGSNTVALQFDPSLAEEEWYQAEPFSPLWIADTQLLATAALGSENAQMGGPTSLVLYQLNDTLDTIVDGEVIAEGQLIGWDVPGASLWLQMGTEMQSVPLPEL